MPLIQNRKGIKWIMRGSVLNSPSKTKGKIPCRIVLLSILTLYTQLTLPTLMTFIQAITKKKTYTHDSHTQRKENIYFFTRKKGEKIAFFSFHSVFFFIYWLLWFLSWELNEWKNCETVRIGFKYDFCSQQPFSSLFRIVSAKHIGGIGVNDNSFML